jgi:hypothetical protein
MRRVTVHKKTNLENDELMVVTIFEPGIKKEDLKKQNIYSKNHQVLIFNGHSYEFKEKRA